VRWLPVVAVERGDVLRPIYEVEDGLAPQISRDVLGC